MRIFVLTCSSALALAASPAMAQLTDDNAVGEAKDAFGLSIGGEQIGIYGTDNVRNFSPIAAGNVRIEGLYFDQQAHVTDRLVDIRSIHVGISAQGYPFPAPTGIADYELRRPGRDAIASATFTYGPYGGTDALVDGGAPLIGDKLGIIGGVGIHRIVFDSGYRWNTESYGLSLRYEPSSDFSIQPFYGRINLNEGNAPLIVPNGAFLPPKVDGAKFYGQKWADEDTVLQAIGAVARAQVSSFDVRLGVFRSHRDVRNDFSDLLLDTDQDGHVGDRTIVAEKGNRFASTSGELRISRIFTEGERRHSLHLSLRGRKLQRRYGGSSLVSLGESQTGVKDLRDEPQFTFGPKSHDEVEQQTAGLGYELRWRNLGEFSLGVQKTRYRKSVESPAGPLPETRDSPLLISATAAAYLTTRFAVYGGYTRGLEESEVAPPNAVNRNEAPPALRTRQKDVGIRYAFAPQLSLILGLFDVEKPYFNLDSDLRFRQLGTIRNRGAEFSLAGPLTKHLTVVAGATWLDSKISGELVDQGRVGERPVGSFRLRTLANLNWQLPWYEPLTLTARFESSSDRTANRANSLTIPARWTAGLGARYRTNISGTPILIRANVDNVFNRFGWNVTSSGFFTPTGPRRYSITVSADL